MPKLAINWIWTYVNRLGAPGVIVLKTESSTNGLLFQAAWLCAVSLNFVPKNFKILQWKYLLLTSMFYCASKQYWTNARRKVKLYEVRLRCIMKRWPSPFIWFVFAMFFVHKDIHENYRFTFCEGSFRSPDARWFLSLGYWVDQSSEEKTPLRDRDRLRSDPHEFLGFLN